MKKPATFAVSPALLRVLVSGTIVADIICARRFLDADQREEMRGLALSLETLDLDETSQHTIEPKPKRTRKPKTKAKPSPRRSARKAQVRR